MAIKDLQERLKKSEGASGDLLYNELLAALDKVWTDGYEGEKTPLLDSYWNEAYEEFKNEGKRAVKKGKSKDVKDVLGDLKDLQKSIAATEEISGSGIAAGTLKMIDAIEPHIQKRIKTLGKNEGIFKSMKKKAIGSAVGAVEGFASNLLAPLPFGAGEAIIGKAKEFIGGGAGERREEQAVTFAGKVGRGAEENESSPIEKVTEEIMGGESTGAGNGGGGLGKTNEILTEIEEHLQFMTDNMEDAESRRERLRDKGLKKAGGAVAGVGMEEGEDDGGFLSNALGTGVGMAGWAGIRALIGKGIFAGKGGLFRNLKAALLRITRSAFGKGGGQLLSKVFTGLGVLGKLAGIAGVVIAPIIDGILGYFNAEKWGVSKMSGIIGGVFGGGEGGIFNMFMNAGKWAIIGATAGSVFPVVGTLIGGIAGAILGAILGFFGGDKIAKLIDDIGAWIGEKWTKLKVFLGFEKETEGAATKRISEERKTLETQLATAQKKKLGKRTGFASQEIKDQTIARIQTELGQLNEQSVNLSAGLGGITEEEKTSKITRIRSKLDMMKSHLPNATVHQKEMWVTGIGGQPGEIEKLESELKLLQGSRKTGGPIHTSGMYNLHAGEMVMDNQAAQIMMNAVSMAGATMNTLAMDRIGLNGRAGTNPPPAIIDNSTVQNISNNTLIRPPSPAGQLMAGERGDFVSKVA